MAEMVNIEIARRLQEVAGLLEEQGANPYRIQAYRRTARHLTALFSNTARAHQPLSPTRRDLCGFHCRLRHVIFPFPSRLS